MKNAFKTFLAVVTLAVMAIVASPLSIGSAQAATPNYSNAVPGVVLLPIHLDGQFTADTSDVATIKLPFPARVIGVSTTARASGGTTPTLTVDVSDDGTSILSSVVSVTAGTVAEATIDTALDSIADESEITIDLVITGTSPTWDDIDILLTLIRN